MRYICKCKANLLILVHGYVDIYSDYMSHDSICVKLDRALYGTIEAAKVWYDTLSTNLLSRGFKANMINLRFFFMLTTL